MMKTSDFYYDLPKELIAQTPADPRDSARLLVYDRKIDETRQGIFHDITRELWPGDVLVLNETKVIPARLFGKKRDGGREVEFLLLERLDLQKWDVILRPGKKLRIGDWVDFAPDLSACILEKKEDGVCTVSFSWEGVFEEILDRVGSMPLPPYITKKLENNEDYQTVYAKTSGSAAAPTAGLHFTDELIVDLKKQGVQIVRILLHVGLGTFRPVKSEYIEDHLMHRENYVVSSRAAQAINEAHQEKRRVIAVGTTSVRTLESITDDQGIAHAGSGSTDIFIHPGYQFRCVDGIITNFHLPESTLIMLVSAFAGYEKTMELYHFAVQEKYRFFSFGDAMMIV